MRRITLLAVLLALLTAPVARAQSGRPPGPRSPEPLPITTIADTVPPPPGAPNLAWLSSIEVQPGLADSLRRMFMGSFRGAFAEGAYATEREVHGQPAASIPVSARFRLIEGTSGWGVWNVQVVVKPAAAPAGRPSDRLTVTIAVQSPEAADAGARPIPAVVDLVIDRDEPRDGTRVTRTPSAWWRIAGRATALLALEQLHHATGDLDEDTHMTLGPARRAGR
jgi:hypothetical protein